MYVYQINEIVSYTLLKIFPSDKLVQYDVKHFKGRRVQK